MVEVVAEGIDWAALPLKIMVPEDALITPLVRLMVPLMVWVVEPILYVPLVSVRAVVMVVLEAVVTPPVLLMVRLFTGLLNVPEGMVMAVLPLKNIVPEEASMVPLVRLIVPRMVWVLPLPML